MGVLMSIRGDQHSTCCVESTMDLEESEVGASCGEVAVIVGMFRGESGTYVKYWIGL